MNKLIKLVSCGIFVAAITSSVLIYQYGTMRWGIIPQSP